MMPREDCLGPESNDTYIARMNNDCNISSTQHDTHAPGITSEDVNDAQHQSDREHEERLDRNETPKCTSCYRQSGTFYFWTAGWWSMPR